MASDPVHVHVDGPEDDQELELFMTPCSTIYHVKCMIGDYWQISPMCQTLTMVVDADDPRAGVCSKELKRKRTLIASGKLQLTALPPVELTVQDDASLGSCMHGLDPTVRLTMSPSWESVTQCLLHVDPIMRHTAVRALARAEDPVAAARDIINAPCLLDRVATVRIAAIEVLQELWPKISSDDSLHVVEQLVPVLEDWEEPVRDATVIALSHMITSKDKDIHKAIRQRLTHFKPCVRIATLTLLANVLPKGGDIPACLEICKMIEDPYSEVKKQVAKTLVAISNPGDPKVFSELANRLSVKHTTEVRLTALDVFTQLAKAGEEKALQVLQGFIRADPIPEIRQHAAEGLAKVSNNGNAEVVKELVIALGLMRVIPGALDPPQPKKRKKKKRKTNKEKPSAKNKTPSDKTPSAKDKTPSAKEAKNKEDSDEEDEAVSSGSEAQTQAENEEGNQETNLPGQVPEDEEAQHSEEEQALPKIIAPPADEDWRVRFALAESLGKLAKANDSIALEALVAVISDDDARVRRIALDGFLRLAPKGDSKYREAIAKLFEHYLGDVRHLALTAFKHVGSKGDEATQNALIGATRDECAEVRKAALEMMSEFARKGDAKVNAAIAACLRDELAEIRLAALEALIVQTNKGDKTHATAVQDRIEDRSLDVQVAARRFFSMI